MKLEHDKIYYVAAPLTSCGNIDANYFNENYYHAKISDLVKGSCGIIRPLAALPDARVCDMDWAEAMQKCRALLSVADGIILCPGWEESTGCQEEYQYAKHAQMEIFEVGRMLAEEYDKVYGAKI